MMASATPFGVIHQSGAVAQTVEEKINPCEDSYTKEAGEQPSEKVHPTENSYQKETGEPISEKTGHESLSDSADEEQLKPQIHELARNLTYHSVKDGSGNYVNPFSETSNPVLDPRSDSFNYKSWMRTILAIHSRDPERYPKRVAGIAYRNLSAHGFGEATDYQKTFGNYPLEIPSLFKRIIGRRQQTKIQILRDFDGLVRSGEMLVVLGRPGSGCSTLLKTISGETDGYYIDEKSYINYQGISVQQMHNDFRGECIYQAETDVHFPQLTVGQTLEFAAKARGKYSSQGPSDFCIDLSKLLGKESQV
ncbi:hypothetical protein WAI453_010052 [Rhynchosporium graminicola]